MKREILLLIIVAVLAVAVLVWGYFYSKEDQSRRSGEVGTLTEASEKNEQITMKSYNFSLVDSREKRAQGLSGRNSLPENTVMLFDFETDDICGIWMKDMKFSLDLIWIDSNFKIIDFKEEVALSTYPTVFTPISFCRYLIEVKEGFIKENNIALGDNVLVDFANFTLKITKTR
ncbi:MAG: DUF192 domain-containing protein [Patescibacteria group bacterium]